MMVQKLEQKTAEEAANEIAVDIIERNAPSRNGGNLFLLGAGASYSCDIPLAPVIAEELEDQLRKKGKWKEPNENNRREMSRYEWAMHQFHKDTQLDIIRSYIEKARASDGTWKLNHCYLTLAEIWERFPNYPRTLLTTNFDPLFFYAMMERNIEPKLIRHVAEMDHMNPFKTNNFPSIIFLHGYWQNHLILNTPKQWDNVKNKWGSRLSGELKNYGLVVLGYSGGYNDILMLTLDYIRNSMHTTLVGPIYWCHLDEIPNYTYAALQELDGVYTVKIKDADSFMLKIGEKLKLPGSIKFKAFSQVIGKQAPGIIEEFKSHAGIAIESLNDEKNGVKIIIQTDEKYDKPGLNYAGVVVFPVKRLFDLSNYSSITLEYDAEVTRKNNEKSFFEIKLQSKEAAHIELAPVDLNKKITISLEKYKAKGIDLKAVDRLVVAANCEQIGSGARLELRLRRIDWLQR